MDEAAGPSAPTDMPWSGGGREELTDAVRRLAALTVSATAPPEVLAAAAAAASRLAGELEGYVPERGPVPFPRFADRSLGPGGSGGMVAAMPFDMIIGSCNPLAPPIEIRFEADTAVGVVTFTAPYEGAPGCVHGAALAGAFDIMLTAANIMVNGAGPTVRLSIRYRRPTLVDVPVRFEAWVTAATERRTHSEGRLLQDGVVTVEAVGEFVSMEHADIGGMHRREDRGAGAADRGTGGDPAPGEGEAAEPDGVL